MKKSIPTSTYRLQFTPAFRFTDAESILPYLRELGISHIYASPVTRARKGSMHGYDVCDPREVNPDLGTPDEFTALLEAAARHGIGWIQDIVPNHMAFSHENPFLLEVLEQGNHSRYGSFFDITWDHHHPSLQGKLLAPFLGKPYGQCVVDGDLRIVFENGGFWVAYYDKRYPLAPETYRMLFNLETVPANPGDLPDRASLVHFDTLLDALAAAAEQKHCSLIADRKQILFSHITANGPLAAFVTERLTHFATGTPEGNVNFDGLMSHQHFRLAFWKIAAEELNYRRFFTVSDLICVRVEYPEVFDITHGFMLNLVSRGLVTGLRIDHIDGLFNPAAYLERLRRKAPDAYITVEKILDINEKLPADWPVDGTTGYDFLNYCNYVFCDNRTELRYTRNYERFSGQTASPAALQLEKKRLIIGKHMAGDIDSLARLILAIASTDLMGRDITLYALRRAVVEILTHFPVYRTYITERSFTDYDGWCIKTALALSRRTLPALAVEFDFIERFLMMKGDTILQNNFDEAWKHGVMRFQQFTGPLMAKGFEDTFFYVYNRHIALNEVGGWPTHFGIPLRQFFAFIADRKTSHPFSMNATATHDTKRGEDTRARLQVLSEIPFEWARVVISWRKLTTVHLTAAGAYTWPDRNDEYLLYQTLAGTLPSDGSIDGEYIRRIRKYMVKAVREAKVHTAWIKPDDAYENAVIHFVEQCLQQGVTPLFTDSLKSFVKKLSWHGALNSIIQLVLKCLLPGIPDIYQGTEFRDFSLVDPDNRRSVDFSARQKSLSALPDLSASDWTLDSEVLKQCCLGRLLHERKNTPDLFNRGTCAPLGIKGLHGRELITFSRIHRDMAIFAVLPRFTTHLVKPRQLPVGRLVWDDTRVTLPAALKSRSFVNIFTGERFDGRRELHVGDLLTTFPAGVFRAV